MTDPKRKVAETLDEFRGQFAYNLLDEPLRRFAARVPQVNQWDDHEVTNNWYPGEILEDPRYTEKSVDVLAARGRRAFHEWLPTAPRRADADGRLYRRISHGRLLDVFVLDMRTYKDPNGPNRYADPSLGLLGGAQRDWLKRELALSRATWKVLAIDLPLGLVVPDGPSAQEGVAQGDPGAALGRELEFADVLGFAHRQGIEGIVMLTADVHYTAAHFYDPARGGDRRLQPVLGVRLRTAERRRVRAQCARRDVRPRGGLRRRPAAPERLAARGLPVLRPRGHRRAHAGDDGVAARPRRDGALLRRPRARPACAAPLGVQLGQALGLVVERASGGGVEALERSEADPAALVAPGPRHGAVDEERRSDCGSLTWKILGRCSSGRMPVRRAWTSSVASQVGRKRTGAGVSAGGSGARGRSSRVSAASLRKRRSPRRSSAGSHRAERQAGEVGDLAARGGAEAAEVAGDQVLDRGRRGTRLGRPEPPLGSPRRGRPGGAPRCPTAAPARDRATARRRRPTGLPSSASTSVRRSGPSASRGRSVLGRGQHRRGVRDPAAPAAQPPLAPARRGSRAPAASSRAGRRGGW